MSRATVPVSGPAAGIANDFNQIPVTWKVPIRRSCRVTLKGASPHGLRSGMYS